MQETGKRNVVTVDEAALRLQMTESQVIDLIEADILPACEIDGQLLVPEDALAIHPHGACDPGCAGRSFCGADRLV